MIDLNEIKKVLYKEKPIAKSLKTVGIFDSETYIYYALTSLGLIEFKVPLSEMGENIFDDEVPAQLLIRWITYLR